MRALVVPCVILTRRSATFTTWIMSLCPGLINPLQLKFYNLSRQFQIYCYYDNIIYIYICSWRMAVSVGLGVQWVDVK